MSSSQAATMPIDNLSMLSPPQSIKRWNGYCGTVFTWLCEWFFWFQMSQTSHLQMIIKTAGGSSKHAGLSEHDLFVLNLDYFSVVRNWLIKTWSVIEHKSSTKYQSSTQSCQPHRAIYVKLF